MVRTRPRAGKQPVRDASLKPDNAIAGQSQFRRGLSSTAGWIFGVDVVLAAAFTLLSHHQVFGSWLNINAIMEDVSEGLLLSLGLSMLMGATIIDLSLGANLVLSSVVGAVALRSMGALNTTAPLSGHLGAILVCAAACLAAGAAFGLINGLIITVLDINSLIATLGTLGMGTGLAFVIAGGNDIYGAPTGMSSNFALSHVLRIPLPLVVGLVTAVWLAWVLRKTRFGMRTLLIGSNRVSAERAGIKISPHILKLTTLAGMLAGAAGFIDLARFGSTNVNGHALDSLNAVTAVVLGGTALFGGRISIWGTLWGTLLASMLLDGLVVLNVQSFYQQIATGAILVVAVAVGRYRDRRQAA
jgi:ribose transport system permease protein